MKLNLLAFLLSCAFMLTVVAREGRALQADSAPPKDSPTVLTRAQVARMAQDADLSIYHLTRSNVEAEIAKAKAALIFFSEPGCKYCQRLTLKWLSFQKVAEPLIAKGIITAKANCHEMDDVCDAYNIQGFPTIFLFHQGKLVEEYTGDHTTKALMTYFRDRVLSGRGNESEL